MTGFLCAHCGKKLPLKPELAGKKVRCPQCGLAVLVPERDATLASLSKPVPPRTSEQPTMPPGTPAATPAAMPAKVPGQAGQDSMSDSSGQTNAAAAQGLTPELTEFLAPAQAPDELGRLGPYRVLQVLGAGGMGVVYRAEDPLLQRAVALKAMLPGLAASGAAKQRFLREARAAAGLKHDHIVAIYQVGEDRGAPFLAMEFLEGESLDERLKRQGKLPLAEVLRIGREVADGLEVAHAKGLIHRDIKPANIWLEKLPGDRRSSGPRYRVKILDFGLARATADDSHLTQSGAIIGTPAYMAPEQAQGKGVGPRSDLFSLGCVLYRMCTGQPAFRGSDSISTLVAVATEDPPPPRAIDPGLPPALSDLVMRLLAKKPEQRPASAAEVAERLDALARGGAGRTTKSKPAAAVRPRRESASATVALRAADRGAAKPWPMRTILILAGSGLAALCILVVLIVLLSGSGGEGPPAADNGSPQQKKQARTDLEVQPLELAAGDPLSGLAVVRKPAVLPGVRSWTLLTRPHVCTVTVLAYSPDGGLLASAGLDGHIRLWAPQTGTLVGALVGHGNWVFALAWSADGHYLASAGSDATVRIWEPRRGVLVRTFQTRVTQNNAPAWLSGGSQLAYQLQIWDARNGRDLQTVSLRGDAKDMLTASWSPGGKRLATGHQQPNVNVWDPDSGRLLHKMAGAGGALSWAPNGKTLASWYMPGGGDRIIRLWTMDSGQVLGLEGHPNLVMSVAWNPDGKGLASASLNDRVVRLWDTSTGKQIGALPGHYVDVDAVAWSPDGKTVASGDPQGTVRLWDPDTQKERQIIEGLGWFETGNQDARIPLRENLGLVVSLSGHYRCPPWLERELVYVVQTDTEQLTLTPAEFSQRYGWNNDPERVPIGGP